MNDMIRAITEFVFAEDALEPADLITAVGSTHPEIPLKAADLYHNGYARQILVTGRYSYDAECFPGLSDGAELYTGSYATEARFYTAVLLKNGVPLDAVLREEEARCAYEHAQYSKLLLEKLDSIPKTMIVICPAYQSRQYQFIFQAAFPDCRIRMKPSILSAGIQSISRDNWHTTRYGIYRVMKQLGICGELLTPMEIERICTDPEVLFDQR